MHDMLLSYNHKVEETIVCIYIYMYVYIYIYIYEYNRTKCTYTHSILSSIKFLKLLLK